MIEHEIRLDARETYPLARALVFTQGDRDSSLLRIRFFDGETPLGTEAGCSATLQVLPEGGQEAGEYILTKEEGGYTLALSAELLSLSGVARCTACLYDELGARLTVGRFTYCVLPDQTLEAGGLTAERVGLLQQALSSVALAYDRIEEIRAALDGESGYAKQMGDYARQWGEAAKNAVEGVAVTWSTLPGRPSSFPPSTHTHREFTLIRAEIPKGEELLQLRAPADTAAAFDAVKALLSSGQKAGFFPVTREYNDLSEASGVLCFFALSDGFLAAHLTAGGVKMRAASSTGWLADWA